jgi:putative RecB family exonuclease
MADKEILARIKNIEQQRHLAALDMFGVEVSQAGIEAHGLAAALDSLQESFMQCADLYAAAKLKGAQSTYVVPLRHAAAEVGKVADALRKPRPGAEPERRVGQCPGCEGGAKGPIEPHEWIGGEGGEKVRCRGIPAPHDLTGLDQLIADSVAEGRGGLRGPMTEAQQREIIAAQPNGAETLAKLDSLIDHPIPTDGLTANIVEHYAAMLPESLSNALAFPGQVSADEVTAYLKGDVDTLSGLTDALVPGSVRDMSDRVTAVADQMTADSAGRGAVAVLDKPLPPYCRDCDLDTHRCYGCGEPVEHGKYACAQCELIHADADTLPIGHSFSENADCVACSLCGEACLPGNLCTCCRTSAPMPPCCAHMLNPDEDPRPWCECESFADMARGHAGACRYQAHLRADHLTPAEQLPTMPKTWESDTMTADGYRTPGAPIPPVPLLGQPGDGGAGYDPKYMPPGGIPFTFAELMAPVPYAALPPHLSHSQIEAVGECPAKYRMQRLARPNGPALVEGVEQIPQWALIGGNAFHAAVEFWERMAAEHPGIDLAQEDCDGAWRCFFGEEIARIEAVSPVPRSMWRASKKGAEGETWWNANGPEMLRKYLAARPAEPTMTGASGVTCIEAELTVTVPTAYGPLPFKAILDRVTVQPDGTLMIRDYKSGDRMPDSTDQLAEQAWTLALHSGFTPEQIVPGSVFGTYYNARKGTWTEPVDLFAEYSFEWFVYHVTSAHAQRLALTTGPTPARKASFCGGCSVRWACPVGGPKR